MAVQSMWLRPPERPGRVGDRNMLLFRHDADGYTFQSNWNFCDSNYLEKVIVCICLREALYWYTIRQWVD